MDDRGNADIGLRITLLGGFRVWMNGVEIPASAWRLQKARGIVKLLALSPELSLHRAELIDRLWPEFDPSAAANNLHRTLYAARRALGVNKKPASPSPTLRLRGQLVVLDPAGPISIDVNAFMQAARDARSGREVDRYLQALSLNTGELLPEDRYEDWVTGPREMLRQERLSLLSGLAELYRAQGDLTAATEIRAEIVRDDPFDEEAQTILIRDLAITGQRGKALSQFHELRTALQELDVTPSLESERLYRDILARRFPPSTVTRDAPEKQIIHRNNLPAPLTSFVGREMERSKLAALLDPQREDPRLVTLTGPGGSGKTRLALVVAGDLAGSFPDGVWFADLSSLADPDGLPGAIASSLDIDEVPGRSMVDVIVDVLRTKSILLVWDNCEHLLDASARLARLILLQAAGVRILSTSRAPLGVHGEAVWRVDPLPVPDQITDQADSAKRIGIQEFVSNPSVHLFCERARLVRPGFSVTVENASSVALICRRLDGMPLALELAAARMGSMSAKALAGRLDRALHVLASGGLAISARQRTLRNTLDWSYELLSAPERSLFRRLATFAGGWTLEMAENVCADEQLPAQDVLGLLADLIDRSLIQFNAEGNGGRYHLLEVVRQYAEECLIESGEADAVRFRHAHQMIDLAETAEPAMRGPEEAVWLDRLDREYDNIRSAIQCLSCGDDPTLALRLAGAIWWFCYLRGHYAEERERLTRLLDQVDAAGIEVQLPVRAKALLAAGALAWKREELPLARRLLEESVAIGRQLGDPAEAGWSLAFLGHVAGSQGDFMLGEQCVREAADLFRVAGDRIGLARALNALGEEARRTGDDEQAEIYYRESLEFDRLNGNRSGMCLRFHNLGYVALHRDRTSEAAEMFFTGLELARDLKDLDAVAACLEGIGAVEAVAGEARRAMRLFGAADALRVKLNVPIDIADQPEHDRYFAQATMHLARDSAAMEWQSGRNMSVDAAINEATCVVHELNANVRYGSMRQIP